MFLFAFVWIYQGIVPKLLFTHLEEVKMLSVLIGSNESSICILKIIDVRNNFRRRMAVANNKTKLFILHIIVLLVLTLAAGFTNIASFTGSLIRLH